MVSSLPTRSENTHHVSLIANYPANLEALGEPIRQVLTHPTHTRTYNCTNERLKATIYLYNITEQDIRLNCLFGFAGSFHSVGGRSRNQNVFERTSPARLPLQKLRRHLQTETRHGHGRPNVHVQEYDEGKHGFKVVCLGNNPANVGENGHLID